MGRYSRADGSISIHAAREGGDIVIAAAFASVLVISIHAAREGGDVRPVKTFYALSISIHAAREGGDFQRLPYKLFTMYFNPRRP